MNILNSILDFIMNAGFVIIVVLSVLILILIWKVTVIYEWHLQNKKAEEQDKESDTE